MNYRGNLCTKIRDREIGQLSCHKFKSSQHVTISLIKRLGLEKELESHRGCVNCLEWNEVGNLLASGSDDCNVILWDPFSYRLKASIPTGHEGNIFSVKFLPKTGDQTIVSGAADNHIRVHDVEQGRVIRVYTAHFSRVKRLAIAPGVPNLFWSASEDGTIRQFDLRDSSSLSANPTNVLVNLNAHLGPQAEAKCLAVNPRYPHLLAVGANDPYVRVFDRRKLSLQTVSLPTGANTGNASPEMGSSNRSMGLLQQLTHEVKDEVDSTAVQYYVPGHLPQRLAEYHRRFRSLATTYLAYSADGVDLIVNIGGEQIYLYNTHNNRPSYRYEPPILSAPSPSGSPTSKAVADLPLSSNGTSNGRSCLGSPGGSTARRNQKRMKRGKYEGRPLPQRIEDLKVKANKHFEQRNYSSAISLYNDAISQAPEYAVLFGNRAAALMNRSWDGDLYSALLDCQRAIELDFDHVKAHYRMARCLYELERYQEARDCLLNFFQQFPNFACNPSCEQLNVEITRSIEKEPFKSNHSKNEESQNGSSRSRSGHGPPDIFCHSPEEIHWRRAAFDFTSRFLGHCNTTTDIKEANFFGSEGQFIVAGSDDGSFFIWDRHSTNIVRVLRGDESIVNCLQPHPDLCLLATSGIDPVVRLWSPLPENGRDNTREVTNRHDAAYANQRRMNSDPINMMLIHMGYRLGYVDSQGDDEYVIARASVDGSDDEEEDEGEDERPDRRYSGDSAPAEAMEVEEEEDDDDCVDDEEATNVQRSPTDAFEDDDDDDEAREPSQCYTS